MSARNRLFEALYRAYSRDVFRYLRARVASDAAAELTAVTFERALGAYDRFRPSGAGERAWLIRIARNASIDASRKARRVVDGDPGDQRHSSAGDAIEQLVELRLLLESLPDAQRDAIHLRYAGGLTTREIGVVIGKSETATQKLISRALTALREAYRDDL